MSLCCFYAERSSSCAWILRLGFMPRPVAETFQAFKGDVFPSSIISSAHQLHPCGSPSIFAIMLLRPVSTGAWSGQMWSCSTLCSKTGLFFFFLNNCSFLSNSLAECVQKWTDSNAAVQLILVSSVYLSTAEDAPREKHQHSLWLV